MSEETAAEKLRRVVRDQAEHAAETKDNKQGPLVAAAAIRAWCGVSVPVQAPTIEFLTESSPGGTPGVLARLSQACEATFEHICRSAMLPSGYFDGIHRAFELEQRRLLEDAVREGREAAERFLGERIEKAEEREAEASTAKVAAQTQLVVYQNEMKVVETKVCTCVSTCVQTCVHTCAYTRTWPV